MSPCSVSGYLLATVAACGSGSQYRLYALAIQPQPSRYWLTFATSRIPISAA
ncbi:hypothetical protein DPMN_142019 [Dreissena polymorpha]|uniref:Uncharacterized protein n=1 Tax=Dreissena polymorpha TaxID=45954 RepID=A0A9D4JLT7_DREPO|nr:hypothetical protein DPMN_142019 [Dreissena polymorpha]